MGFRTTLINALGGQVKTTNQAVRGNDFLIRGNRDQLRAGWSEVKMTDEDMYRGYTYAAIQKRGNKVASLAKDSLKTTANQAIVEAFQKKEEVVQHPYLKLIENSTDFTHKQFWKNISIYLDLAGRYYLGVVRNEIKPKDTSLPSIITDVNKFIMLNPYEVRRVINKDGDIAGYIESKSDGRYREWPSHQIIVMKDLNPFDSDSQWAMTDAAKEAVFTMSQSGDYTRKSLQNNLNAPGIITTDVILDDNDFDNFKARVRESVAGEPLYGNGSGAIHWQDMKIDLDKAALLDINEINRNTLFAVSGTSKTTLGIEESGTTRETSKTQTENFISDTAAPRLEDIIDFLNLDYKRSYTNEFKTSGYLIEITGAIAKDYELELKATELRDKQFQLADQLYLAGYEMDSAVKYAKGELDLNYLEKKEFTMPERPELGQTSTEPDTTEDKTPTDTSEEEIIKEEVVEEDTANRFLELNTAKEVTSQDKEQEHVHCESCVIDNKIETYHNKLSEEDIKIMTDAYDSLLNTVRSIQKDAIEMAIAKVDVNNFQESDIITKELKETLSERLINAFREYWWILIPLFANNLTNQRNFEFDKTENFKFSKSIKDDITKNAKIVGDSHLSTVLNDILSATNRAYTKIVEKVAAELLIEAYKKNPDKYQEWFSKEPTNKQAQQTIRTTDILEKNKKIYEKANKMALDGYDRVTIVKSIQKQYDTLSKSRAITIARNETSRAFTQSQYEADYQFLKNVGKLDSAYKELYSRSGDPCNYCQALIEQGPIKFTDNFLTKGEVLTIENENGIHSFEANFEDIKAGVVHVNCQCEYRLVFLDKEGIETPYGNSRGNDNSIDSSINNWLGEFSNDKQESEVNANAQGLGQGGKNNPGRPTGGSKAIKVSDKKLQAVDEIMNNADWTNPQEKIGQIFDVFGYNKPVHNGTADNATSVYHSFENERQYQSMMDGNNYFNQGNHGKGFNCFTDKSEAKSYRATGGFTAKEFSYNKKTTKIIESDKLRQLPSTGYNTIDRDLGLKASAYGYDGVHYDSSGVTNITNYGKLYSKDKRGQ